MGKSVDLMNYGDKNAVFEYYDFDQIVKGSTDHDDVRVVLLNKEQLKPTELKELCATVKMVKPKSVALDNSDLVDITPRKVPPFFILVPLTDWSYGCLLYTSPSPRDS